MDSINSIIDFNEHPINDLNYIQKCNSLIKKNSLLVLENFLLDKSLKNILNEAKQLEDKAYYCEQQHTILLTKLSDSMDKNDPLNILMTSDKGCVPHDLFSKVAMSFCTLYTVTINNRSKFTFYCHNYTFA